MTAATAYMERPERLTLAPPIAGAAAPSQPGVSQRVGNGIKAVWRWVRAAPGRFWGWLNRVLHLQPVVDKINEAFAWTVSALRAFKDAMGFSGMSGIGLLAVSTGFGRWALGTLVVTPLRWVADLIGKAWSVTKVFFADNVGSFGDWLAQRMACVDEFLLGKLNAAGTGRDGRGLFGKVKAFYYRHLAVHWDLNSVFMRVVRLVGTLLFSLPAIAALPLLGLAGSTLVYASYAAKALLYGTAAWQSFFLGKAIGEIPEVNAWINKTKGDVAAAAEKIAGPRPKMGMHEAAMASTYSDGRVVPRVPPKARR